MTAPFFTVIVLNWNGGAMLARCLDCLAAQTFTDAEVLVVDNASTDGSAQGLEQRWSGARLLSLAENLGFCAGNNAGLAQAHGQWVVFLNNDAYPIPTWLEALAAAIAQHPTDSFFASCLVPADAPQVIQSAGDVVHITGFAWPGRAGQALSSLPEQPFEVFAAGGAALTARRELLLEVGGFDPDFGSHLEDVDLSFRLRLRGQTGWLVPRAVVLHTGSASYGLESERTVYQVQRNGLWLYLANMPGGLVWKYLPLRWLLSFMMLLNYLRRGRGRAALRARWDALKGARRAWRKRQVRQAGRTVSVQHIEARLARGVFTPLLLGRMGRRLRISSLRVDEPSERAGEAPNSTSMVEGDLADAIAKTEGAEAAANAERPGRPAQARSNEERRR